MRSLSFLNCLIALSSGTAWALSGSAPTPLFDEAERPGAVITPSPTIITSTRASRHRRQLSPGFAGLKDFENPPDFPDFFPRFPKTETIQSYFSLDNSQVQALPTQVLNLRPYANWTDSGWNVRFSGNVYKQPNSSAENLQSITSLFLYDLDIYQLPADQAAQARNLTSEIFVFQQGGQRPIFNLGPATSASGRGSQGSTRGDQQIQLPDGTAEAGDYEAFLPIQLHGLAAGNETTEIQELQVHTQGTDSGNATAYLVPPGPGLTVVSDIDDILRVTKIWDPREALLNTFARPFTPWLNMPEVYRDWSQSLALGDNATHFHYLTNTPEEVVRNYMSFVYANYPAGSFDTQSLGTATNSGAVRISRYWLLTTLFETFPQRKFILVADTSNSDVMESYPGMARRYPQQVQCIFLRNTSATDPSDNFAYNTSYFEGIDQSKYMFFVVPDDLKGLDIANGQCVNASVPQHVTFDEQGLPSDDNNNNTGSGDLGSDASSSRGLHKNLAATWLIGVLFAVWHAL